MRTPTMCGRSPRTCCCRWRTTRADDPQSSYGSTSRSGCRTRSSTPGG
jgi:hypothetical protein